MKAILTSKRGADGTLQSQFMLFCVITSHYGTGHTRETGPVVSLFSASAASLDILSKKFQNHNNCQFKPTFHKWKNHIPLFAWPALSVVPRTISDYLKALSRASVPCSHNCDVCDAVTMIHLVSGDWPAPTCPHKYSSISFLTSQPSQARPGQGNEIWYKLNIKSIFCCLSASVSTGQVETGMVRTFVELNLGMIHLTLLSAPLRNVMLYIIHVHTISSSLSVNGSEFEQLIEILYT